MIKVRQFFFIIISRSFRINIIWINGALLYHRIIIFLDSTINGTCVIYKIIKHYLVYSSYLYYTIWIWNKLYNLSTKQKKIDIVRRNSSHRWIRFIDFSCSRSMLRFSINSTRNKFHNRCLFERLLFYRLHRSYRIRISSKFSIYIIFLSWERSKLHSRLATKMFGILHLCKSNRNNVNDNQSTHARDHVSLRYLACL